MKLFRTILRYFLLIFGLISIFMTTSVIFDLFGIRAIEGNFVYPVVYANLICGFLYLIAVYFWNQKPKIATNVLLLAFLLLLAVFSWFLFYIKGGGIHEPKTIKAMGIRTIITLIAYWIVGKKQQ